MVLRGSSTKDLSNPGFVGPITDLHQEYGRYGPYVITKSGSMLGAVSLAGFDPCGLTVDDHRYASLVGRNIYQSIADSNEDVTLTQYYAHFENVAVTIKDRSHPISHLLSKRREAFLNSKSLSSSNITHYFEVGPRENLSQLNFLSLGKHLGLAFKEKESRDILKRHFSSTQYIVCYLEELKRQKKYLDSVLSEVAGRWGMMFDLKILTPEEIWGHMRFLSNLDPSLLDIDERVPDEQWDFLLSDGDREHIVVDQTELLKFQGTQNTYARIGAVTQLGGDRITPGMWGSGPDSPVAQKGNYILMMRFSPFSKLKQSLVFKGKHTELSRKNVSFGDILKGDDNKSEVDLKATMKASTAQKLKELEEAELVVDRWGLAHAFVVGFDVNLGHLQESCDRLKRSLNKSGFSMCWETVDLPDAWRTILPAGNDFSVRDIQINTTQFGATSLIYRASEGQKSSKDLGGEEAQYIFLSEDNTPFHFNPFVGGRGVVFGVGPIRSGKSFTKNTLATHFMKYGGLFRGIDVDPGLEPVAQCFGDEGYVFRIEDGSTRGFNPFSSVRGDDDFRFVSHLKNLIIQMLKTNDTSELQRLDFYEQSKLDSGIVATLKLPKHLQRLGTVVQHCPRELQEKLRRWTEGGMYGHYFDAEEDAIGAIDQKLAVFNLAGVKDDPVVLPLVMTEIFFRITGAFESQELRAFPKFLDIDEAKVLLRVGYIRDYIIRSVRTWGKWRAGLGMWSQSPDDFLSIDDWPALRSAASTFFFMSDPQMDEGLYKKTFHLTPGECEAIRNLRPKREAYIVQREIGVSKKVILEVEPEQYVVSTSAPTEADLRAMYIKKFGFEEGVRLTIEDLKIGEPSKKGDVYV